MTLTVRHKLFLAAALALALPLVASLQGANAATIARGLLAIAALAGLAWWLHTNRPGSKFKAAPRLQVVQRVGLSPRTGVALVEVDGKPYLIVHGDGFARVRPARRPARVTPRPAPAPSAEAELPS
ncbi:MAG: flagellar biosynthetic protein FliO [Myxococcaceae bacterium]